MSSSIRDSTRTMINDGRYMSTDVGDKGYLVVRERFADVTCGCLRIVRI
jgi:hypothetical protein